MLDEAKKREKIANAVLGATFALSAAQSPKDFIKTGHIESPGTALMQRWGRVRGEAERNLDSGRVVGRNRKIKETYDDEMFRQHSKERPLTSDERTSHSSKTSSLLKKMRELNLSSPKKKKKKKLNEDFNVLDERTLMSRTPTKKSGMKLMMKTFQEFLEEVYLIERGQPTFSSREDLEAHYGGVPKGKTANNSASSGKAKWRLVDTENRREQERRREERIASLSSPEERKAADAKKRKLNRAGLDAHHITPIHYSSSLKASMTDAEWEARKERDAADGIYHGHHHKNLMGAVTDRTPPSRSRRGIRHHGGGAHELEGRTKDIAHVGHKGLLAAAHREKLRKEREANKQEGPK